MGVADTSTKVHASRNLPAFLMFLRNLLINFILRNYVASFWLELLFDHSWLLLCTEACGNAPLASKLFLATCG